MNTNYYLMIKWKGGTFWGRGRVKNAIHMEVLSPHSRIQIIITEGGGDRVQLCFLYRSPKLFVPGISYSITQRGLWEVQEAREKWGLTGSGKITRRMLRLAAECVTGARSLSQAHRRLYSAPQFTKRFWCTASLTCSNSLILTPALQGGDYHHILIDGKMRLTRERDLPKVTQWCQVSLFPYRHCPQPTLSRWQGVDTGIQG